MTPASLAALNDGRMASESKATTRMTSTFWVIRPSMSARLLLRRALRVGRDILVAGSLDDRLDRRFVGLPALFLESLPGHGDRLVLRFGDRRKRERHRNTRQKGGCKFLHYFLPARHGARCLATVAKLFFSSLEKKNDSGPAPCQYDLALQRKARRSTTGTRKARKGGRSAMTVGIRHDDLGGAIGRWSFPPSAAPASRRAPRSPA